MANIATVSFHDQSIIAIEHEGAHFVAMRPIVENIGLDWQAQLQRIKRHPVLSKGVVVITTPSSGGNQETNCLPLSMLNGWLFGVDVNRVREEIRPKLIRYQTECFDVLYQHFMPKAPQPTPYTVQPSDTLSEPQQTALRALLESNVKRLPQEKQAAAMMKGWSKLKSHFKVPYRQIPASEFTEALSIIAATFRNWSCWMRRSRRSPPLTHSTPKPWQPPANRPTNTLTRPAKANTCSSPPPSRPRCCAACWPKPCSISASCSVLIATPGA